MSFTHVTLDKLDNRSRTQTNNRMTATLFGVDISIYENILERGKWYDLIHLIVKPVPERFATYAGEKQLYFTNSTEVHSVKMEASSSQVLVPRSHVPLHDLPREAGKDDRFDIMAVLLWVYPEKLVSKGDTSLPVREISLTDDSCEQTLIVSSWNRSLMNEFEKLEFLLNDDDPIVEIKGLKVSTYTGFSLAGSLSTTVKPHPAGQRADALRAWYTAHKTCIDARVIQAINNEMPGYPTEITTIATALSLKVSDIMEAQVIRVKAHIPQINYEDIKFSFGCRACGKACTDESVQFEQDYRCVSCGIMKKAESRMYLRLKCTDGTGTLTLDAYTRNIEILFQTTSRSFFTMSLPERRAIVSRAEVRFRIGTAEFLIAPVKALFVNNNAIKWFLKEAVV